MKPKSAMLTMLPYLIAMGAASQTNHQTNTLRLLETPKKNKPIPVGCKEYFFDRFGVISSEQDLDTVFKCVASNKNNAVRKFNKFKALQK